MSVTDDPNVRDEALNIGVEDILIKPLECTYLYPKLKILAQQKRLNEGLDQTQKVLFSLAMAIENRSIDDNQTSSFQLANLIMSFAQYLNLDDNDVQDLVFAAYLHDIGTISIPEQILAKKGNLTLEEEMMIHKGCTSNRQDACSTNNFLIDQLDYNID